MFAIIESGGKQYKVELGTKAQVEKLPMDKKGSVVFDKVLLKSDGKKVEVGTPYIDGASIEAKALGEGREKKKIVFRYHSKTRYRKKKGHRQPYSEVEISKI
ncbi:50S ribosomal protein L21 [bacterium]|nr:50S ribosomal protein L21 [bacterium]|tara:strand:+ start:2493 stop:2798 length:306 start_codon:yes stop_codon:yes gene_type:complete